MEKIRINIYAKNYGWLFEDLKNHFRALQSDRAKLLVTDDPLAADQADVWICIRTSEVGATPRPERTLVCLHDLYQEENLYQKGGSRYALREVAGLVLCHPEQKNILQEAGIESDHFIRLERPLGALSIFDLRQQMPEAFTIGWVARNHWRKRPEWMEEVAETLQAEAFPLRVLLLGHDLELMARRMIDKGIDCMHYAREDYTISDYPGFYHQMDALAITSLTEAGPLTLFEALSCGIPVLSSEVGWAAHFAQQAPAYVRLYQEPKALVKAIKQIHQERERLFEERAQIKTLISDWTLESWFEEVVETGIAIASQKLVS